MNRVWNNTSNRNKNLPKQQNKFKQSNNSFQQRSKGPFCPACYYLGQQLQTTIHTKHLPIDCPRKTVAVNMLKMEDMEHFDEDGNNYYITIWSLNIILIIRA